MHLGISGYFHDSSVALLSDNGELLDFKKEEWFSRVKGDKSFPRLSVADVLLCNEIDAQDISSVTFYEKPMKAWLSVLKHSLKINSLTNELTLNYFKNIWKSSLIFSYDLNRFFNFKSKPIYYSDHHLSHTLSAFYYADKQDSYASVVVDGYGDFACTSIHNVISRDEIINSWCSEYPHSLGLFYSAVTDFLGFPINDGEYQVMGLASFGNPRFTDQLSKMIKFVNGELILDIEYFDFVRSINNSFSNKFSIALGVKPRITNKSLDIDDPNFQIYADIAASSQVLLENILELIFKHAHEITGKRKFLFSGGVAMNSVAVKSLAQHDFIDQIIIPPSPGDSGSAIGAAYLGLLKNSLKTKEFKDNGLIRTTLYPGKAFQKDDFFELRLEKIAGPSESTKKAAQLLANDEIIATCYGNIETGPRALGNRSLLCNGHNETLVKKLSEEVKKRSRFRPTAPVVLAKNANNYFNLSDEIYSCYWHMGAVATPKTKLANPINGVVHVDGTCRVQICDENQLIGEILSHLSEFGIDVLANTSFNISSDPMVLSKEDALLSVERMDVTYILTENGLFSRGG